MPPRIKTTSPALTNQESNLSRYRLTAMALEEDGTRCFQLWQPPDFRLERLGAAAVPYVDYQIHIVAAGQEGRLDNLAKLYYGVGMKHLWWVIAWVNDIRNPWDDMYPGQQLKIPMFSDVISSLSGQDG